MPGEHSGAERGRRSGQTRPGDHASTAARISVIPPGTVIRPRLLEQLSQAIHQPLTLVCAPAGFGKPALLASWESLATEPSVIRHIALDGTGEHPARVLESVLGGLPYRTSILTGGLGRRSSGAHLPGRTRFGAATGREAPVLVVDCGDLAISPELGERLQRVVQASAGRLRIVLLTRADPPLPLHRYRLAGTLAEIRAADLAFTVEETADLMRQQSLDLSPAELDVLQDRTDGWPAGLMFAAMSLRGKTDAEQAIREFRGDAGNVAAYLMTEVLDAQPPGLREFALRTSVVDKVRPGLAEALTGRGCDQRSLEFMSHGNSFIQPVPGTEDTFSYQALFREFLRAQLAFEQPALVPELHAAAADWFARNDQWSVAIRHAVAAHRWSDAAQYLVEGLGVAGLLTGPEREFLERSFAALPDDVDGVAASVVRAARALAEYDVASCFAALGKARADMDNPSTARNPSYDVSIAVLEAVATSFEADVAVGLDAVLAAEAALGGATPGSATAQPEAHLLVAGAKGRVLLQRGDFDAALTALFEGVRVAEAAGADDVLVDLLGMAALVEAVWGHLGRAAELACQATELADSSGGPLPWPRSAIVARAWVSTDRGDLNEARTLVRRAADAPATYDARVLAVALALVRARLLWAGGDVELAEAELRAAHNSFGGHLDGWLGQSLVVDAAKILVAQQRPQAATNVIEQSEGRHQIGSLLVLQRAATEVGAAPAPLPPLPRRTLPLDTLVDGCLVQAAQSIRNGDLSRGGLCLERALRLAAPEHLRRPFTEAPPAVGRLLRPGGELMKRHPWLRAPSTEPVQPPAIGQPDGHQADAGIGALTGREQEVLRYLAELLTTEEIASTMYVSVNTVRSHVRSILRKLGASRRNEAVRRAWELGLLPSRPDA